MDVIDAAAFLRDRAESYCRDAQKMDADDDLKAMAAAYRAIARELRDCAKALADQILPQKYDERTRIS